MKRKSILKALLLTVLMCCLTFALVACGGKHTVTFNYGVDGNGDGEVDVVTVEVGDGSLLEEPTDVPTREGYTFVGWGTDNGMWNFEEDTVTSDLTLTARWSAGDPIDPGTPGTTVYVNYELGIGAAKSDPSSVPDRWFGAPGTTIKLPPAPAADAGWEFTGWLVTGETELREEGSDYTVTGTVTITAQWKSVAYTQYTWTVEAQPDASNPGKAKGTPVGGGDTITVDLPVLPADGGYADVPTAGKYNVETADATCTESAKKTLYYTIPQKQTQTQTYESYYLKIREDSLDEPAKGHLYTTWIVTQQPSATAEGTATATCANNCGKTLTITLPEITGNTGSGEGKYTEKAVQQQLSCEKDGIVDYVYTIPASELADSSVSAAAGTVKELSFTVTTPATGHKIEIEVQLSDATETDTVTKASLIARCRNAGCDKGWDEDANPASATVTFNLGDGKVQDGVTLTDADVKFDPETKQFTVTLPGDGAMNLTAGTVFTGWTVNGTNYAAGEAISVAADGTAAVTGNFMEHTHNYGGITFETSGTYAGMFVEKCDVDGCPEPTVVVATTDGTFNPELKNGTSVPIGHKLSADDFTMEVVYKYQIARDGHEIGEMYKKITPETADGYQSDFSNDLNKLSTKDWASGLQATFEFKVDGKTISSGKATFDVVPAADAIFGAETDVQILYNKAGEVARSTEIGALSGAASGMSVSFWLNEQATSDWNAQAITGGTNDKLIITLPNLDWNQNQDGISGQNANPGGHGTLHNGAAWNVFLEQYSYVTITVTTSSVIYYKNGVKVVEYSNTDTQQAQDEQIQAFITALLADIAANGFKFGAGINTKDLLVTTDLDDTQAGAIYEWYSAEYPLTTDGNFVVGSENCVMSFTGTAPVWTGGPVAKGEKIVISGTLRSAAANGWEVPVINLYSGVGNGKTAFRSDGFIITADGGETGWSVAVTPAISGADSNYVGDGAAASNADTAFLTAIKAGVTYTLTYDWTDESKIVVTAVFTDGGEMTRTSTFTVTAAAEQTLADSYNIGIGGENIYLQMTSVTRS